MKASGANPPVTVRVQRLAHGDGIPLPVYQTEHAAGLDLAAAVDVHHPIVLAPGARVLVPTGFVLELPPGFEAQVRPRSGLALRQGITVLNSPGTIDADYRGEVMVLLINLGGAPFEIRRGERIAQLVVAPVSQAVLAEVSDVTGTARGSGGFGSTGTLTPHSSLSEKSTPSPPKSAKAKKAPGRAAAEGSRAGSPTKKAQNRSGKAP